MELFELKNILNYLSTTWKLWVGGLLLGSLVGGVIFLSLPKGYRAEGNLYVSREPQESQEFYTYSGYYNQLTALSFTDTVKGILESYSFQARVLENLGLVPKSANLRQFRRKYRVKNSGPRLIGIEYQTSNKEEAEIVWKLVTSLIEEEIEELTQRGDSSLRVGAINQTPLVKQVERPLWALVSAGGLLGLSGVVFFLLITWNQKGDQKDE